MRLAVAACLVVAACTPCPGQRYVATGQEPAAQVTPELASCAGQKICNAPCIDLFQLTTNDVIESCRVTLDAQGNGTIVARYIDHGVCGANEVLDPSDGAVVADDGDWSDWSGDDGSTDDPCSDGSCDDPCSDGSCDGSDDGSTNTGSDDGSTDDGSTDSGDGGDSGDGWRAAPHPRNANATSWAPMPLATKTLR